MSAHLVAIQGPLTGRVFAFVNGALSIGRTPDNTVQLVDAMSSRRHAELRFDGHTYALTDLGSSNGTFVNGTRVSTHALRLGDVISVGGEAFRFEVVQPVAAPQPTASEMPAELLGLRGPLAGRRIVLVRGSAAFGRTPENDVVVENHMASRKHAEIVRAMEGFVVRDLGSSNGTRLNGMPLTAPQLLRSGDVIEIGDESFRFDHIGSPVAETRDALPPQPAPLPPSPAQAAFAAQRTDPVQPAAPIARAPVNPFAATDPLAFMAGSTPPAGPGAAPNAYPSPGGLSPAAAEALAGVKLTVQCPTCNRKVDIRYQDCPWDGTALVNGRTVY